MKKPLERSIENAVVTYARARGIEAIKLNGLGKRSLPDRLFLGPRRRTLFVEFKRPGEKPTALQSHLHALWFKLGHTVWVVDDVKTGKQLIDKLCLTDAYKHPLEDR